MMTPSLARSLVALRSKYEEMRALRSERAESSPALRKRLATLAARFPGALREIDALPLGEIDRRIAALARAQRDPSARAQWMHTMTRFHALARGALFAKRALSAHPRIARSRWPAEARVWEDDLAHVAKPPRGRLMELVYQRLARELETTPHHAKELVFGPRRR